MAHSATTIDENGICWQYAVARRVVQRSSTLLAIESPWMSLTRDALWRDDPRTAGACRMATAVRCDSGSDGIQRRLLETSLEHSGGTVHGSFGKCTAHQECAGSQDRPEGCGMDCAVAAVWTSAGQL